MLTELIPPIQIVAEPTRVEPSAAYIKRQVYRLGIELAQLWLRRDVLIEKRLDCQWGSDEYRELQAWAEEMAQAALFVEIHRARLQEA